MPTAIEKETVGCVVCIQRALRIERLVILLDIIQIQASVTVRTFLAVPTQMSHVL